MSDDEYYYDSDYEDLQDILYDADPSPDLAGDLAEHAAYSPVWQDDPLAELQNYFSDWEYYSDDYYDDDPKILLQNPQDGSIRPPKPEKRGRKRKLSEAREQSAFDSKETESLAKCIRGTVWAQPSTFKTNTYQQGQNSKVALKLSEEVMGSAYSADRGFGRGRGRIRRDESWANELSLADMGLQNEKRKSLQHEMSFDEDAENDEELDIVTDMDMEGPPNGETDLLGSTDHIVGNSLTTEPLDIRDQDLETQEIPNRAKRRKYEEEQRSNTSVLTSPKLDVRRSERSEIDSHSNPISKRKNDTAEEAAQISTGIYENNESVSPKAGKRKRKLSIDGSAVTNVDKPRQAKRIASSKLLSDQESNMNSVPPTTRNTRSRKK